MSLWKIAWRSIQQRSLASLLTAISMALGVMLVVAVLLVYNVVHQAFHRGGEGYDLIVGPVKGSNLELVLSSVFYIGTPISTLPYRVYDDLENVRIGAGFVKAAVPICLGDVYKGKRVVGTTSAMFKLKYHGNTPYEFADGETFKDAPAYGTKEYDDWFHKWCFTAVAGATAAKQLGLKVGDAFRPTHEVGSGEVHHEHSPFTIVGILKPTGTPNDNVLFVNIEGFYRVGGHAEAGGGSVSQAAQDKEKPRPPEAGTKTAAKRPDPGPKPSDEPIDKSSAAKSPAAKVSAAKTPTAKAPPAAKGQTHADEDDEHHREPIPDSAKRVSAVLVSTYEDWQTLPLQADINRGKLAQAAVPTVEITNLFNNIIGNIELVLLIFAVMIVLVAGIGIMVSIYNSMNDRRHEIAIMRALGARRSTIMVVILLESILLSLGGGLLGLAAGHALLALAGPWIAYLANLPLSMLQFRNTELILVPALVVLASLVGYLPASAAYRTDVGRSLVANP